MVTVFPASLSPSPPAAAARPSPPPRSRFIWNKIYRIVDKTINKFVTTDLLLLSLLLLLLIDAVREQGEDHHPCLLPADLTVLLWP